MSIRMRGFARRSTVADVLHWIDQQATPLEGEVVDLSEAAGRVLHQDVVSRHDVPGFDRSMMDGYAVRAEDVAGASSYQPLPLRVVGQALPGAPFHGVVSAGQAVRIMTGAPQPSGADAVVPAEHVEALADTGGERTIEVTQPLPVGKNVGRVGEDVQQGQRILAAGRRLRPQDLGVLSSIGEARIAVIRRPIVAVLITGDEILPPGSQPQPPRIVDANSPMLAALVTRDGGRLLHCQRIADDPAAIRQALLTEVDVLLVSGGSSVGQEDHAPQLLAELGELAHHGVAMRPSSPAGVGRIGRTLVFLLPGNPVSCLCAYDFFAGRAIRRLAGGSPHWPYPLRRLPLVRKLPSVVGRVDYARVRILPPSPEASPVGVVEPLAISGASMLSSTTRADGFVVIPQDSEGCAAGDVVDVYCYDAAAPGGAA